MQEQSQLLHVDVEARVHTQHVHTRRLWLKAQVSERARAWLQFPLGREKECRELHAFVPLTGREKRIAHIHHTLAYTTIKLLEAVVTKCGEQKSTEDGSADAEPMGTDGTADPGSLRTPTPTTDGL